MEAGEERVGIMRTTNQAPLTLHACVCLHAPHDNAPVVIHRSVPCLHVNEDIGGGGGGPDGLVLLHQRLPIHRARVHEHLLLGGDGQQALAASHLQGTEGWGGYENHGLALGLATGRRLVSQAWPRGWDTPRRVLGT
jgi:hypothetical protein